MAEQPSRTHCPGNSPVGERSATPSHDYAAHGHHRRKRVRARSPPSWRSRTSDILSTHTSHDHSTSTPSPSQYEDFQGESSTADDPNTAPPQTPDHPLHYAPHPWLIDTAPASSSPTSTYPRCCHHQQQYHQPAMRIFYWNVQSRLFAAGATTSPCNR